MFVALMPSRRNDSNIFFPNVSFPIVPHRDAFAPARAAVIAWIDALPPISVIPETESLVSPRFKGDSKCA